VPVSIGPRPTQLAPGALPVAGRRGVPDRACDQSPLAGFTGLTQTAER